LMQRENASAWLHIPRLQPQTEANSGAESGRWENVEYKQTHLSRGAFVRCGQRTRSMQTAQIQKNGAGGCGESAPTTTSMQQLSSLQPKIPLLRQLNQDIRPGN